MASLLLLLAVHCLPHVWSFDFKAPVPTNGNSNPYQLSPEKFAQARRAGLRHALFYPEREAGVLLPYKAFATALKTAKDFPFFQDILKKIGTSPFSTATSTDEVFERLGLYPYPEEEGEGSFFVPFGEKGRPKERMGVTIASVKDGTEVMTFSCASCHTRELFGRPVLGLNNLFSKANEFVLFSKNAKMVTPSMFAMVSGATDAETEIYAEARNQLKFVESKKPIAVGLDTSLATVGLSLALREDDEYATPTPWSHLFPRDSKLATLPADSKPGVWWTVKYKNRFLSDAALEGDPVFTNILWNDIGRGADLHRLEKWLADNREPIQELVSAVYGSEPVRWTEFFPESTIDLEKAKAGQKVFAQACARCHGTYQKRWELPGTESETLSRLFETTEVKYHANTFAMNIGTDPNRADGMFLLAPELNRLEITKKHGLWVTPKKGAYVPPPLVGIWARWPYLHNNSVPNLCELLQPRTHRVAVYYTGAPVDPSRDYDQDCVGYPLGSETPSVWKTPATLYDTRLPGLSNQGHDEGILIKDGQELLSGNDKACLIEFLKTL